MREPSESVWARHFQAAWHDHAHNAELDRWLRVVAFAYAHHDEGGHARFKRGELAAGLTASDEPPLIRQRVSEAIGQAVRMGFLDPRSMPMCLVVPLDQVKKGARKATGKPCPVHSRRQSRRGQTSRSQRDVEVETSRSGLDVSAKRNGPSVTFTREPSLSFCKPTTASDPPVCECHGYSDCASLNHHDREVSA